MRTKRLAAAVMASVLTFPLIALGATTTKAFYLSGSTTPVATLSTSTPPGGSLPDYDGSGEDGRRLNRSDKGVNEDNEDEYQTFRSAANGLQISGQPSLDLWVRMKDEDDDQTGAITAYLLDCLGSACNLLSTATKTLVPGGPWVKTTLTFPTVSHSFADGRELAVKIIVPKDLSDDHMDIAYYRSAYPSSLRIPIPVATTTTSTTTTSTTTTTTTLATTTTKPPSTTTTSTPITTTTSAIGSTSTTVPTTEDPGASTTSTIPETTTSLTDGSDSPDAGGIVSTTSTTLVRTFENLSTEKSNLVVKTTPSQRGVVIAAGQADLSPVEGLMVSFLTAVESIQNKFATSASLGALMSVLLIVGLTRRERLD